MCSYNTHIIFYCNAGTQNPEKNVILKMIMIPGVSTVMYLRLQKKMNSRNENAILEYVTGFVNRYLFHPFNRYTNKRS